MNSNKNWRDKDPDKETSEKWKKDTNNWKFGMFYFNKEDKRLFVSKKIEWMGTTINFANPKSFWFVITMILFFSLVVTTILTDH
jgi:uncharacterized membrane protein